MTRKRLSVLAVYVLFTSVLWLACSGDDDAADLARDLANRLTDSLGFDGAEPQDGAPPPGNEGAEYPQITGFEASTDTSDISYGEAFTLTLTTDFADMAAVIGAIAWVEDSTRHIKITASPSPMVGGTLVLTGTLARNWKLGDRDFVIKMAMLLNTGEVGNYVAWGLYVRKPAGEAGGCVGACDSVSIQSFCVSDSSMCECRNNELLKSTCSEQCEEYSGTCDTAEWGEDYCQCNYPEDEF